jgi:hypothetical protein
MLIPDTIASDTVSSAIATAIAPVFLLAGLGAIMNVIATRLSRAVDRRRLLAGTTQANGGELDPDVFREVGRLDRRIKFANQATFFCVASALAVCIVVIMMLVSQMGGVDLGRAIAYTFISAMVMVACGLISFLIEIQIAIRSLWPMAPEHKWIVRLRRNQKAK